MNNSFSPARFSLLFKKTLLERPMQLLGLAGLSLALTFFTYIYCKIMAGFDTAQNASFMLGLVGGGCFLASFVYGYFSSSAMGSSYLTLPASHFEKWLCGVLLTGIAYMLIFLLFYRFIDTIFVGIYHRSLDPNGPFYKQLYEQVEIFPYDGFVANKGFIMFLNFAGAMLLGSLYFNKTSFIKVALIVCGFWLIMYLLNLLIAKMMIQNVDGAVPYVLVFIDMNKETGRIELPEKVIHIVEVAIQIIIPAILWLLAYLRLKEKEF
ncbi:MAG: hypothetical protein IPP72_08635 [Chitinophagaceae bacterium]|nr:hypothetical protein [Chitinophagaceae bacterium]